ncbi:MAG: Smr/MutS family protein [Pseudomonadota bacterium]
MLFMDQNTLQLLEYEKLLELLAEYARSGPGAERCLGLRPDLDPPAMRRSWRLIDEAREVLGLAGAPPLSGLLDLTVVLVRLEVEGVILRPLELLGVLQVVRTSRLARKFIRSQAERAPLLLEMSENLPVWPEMEDAFERSISPEGEILDSASSGLARVRREFSGLRGAIQDRLAVLMRSDEARHAVQDNIVTRRGGRYVIPLKVGSRRSVPGLVHDFSSSGQTAYVEPMEVVEDNNRLNFLRRQEKKEIEKVLIRLSSMAAGAAPEIKAAGELLAELDVIFSQGALSRSQQAAAPLFDPDAGLFFSQARHPLLLSRSAEDGRRTEPLDLKLLPGARVLVISGINAGGKTVALKTLGLLALMAQTGLHIPAAEGSRVCRFDHILAAMGDEQDLESALSTFSGHIRRLSWILGRATPRSLVLLDELGSGTDPAEGAALALAVLDELRGRGSYVVAATHYHLLKAWAHLTGGVENAAVRTNQGRPVFGLEYGSPGFSDGLAMARGLGLDPEIVARAETYLDDGQKKTIALMQRLEEERAELHQVRLEHEVLNEELGSTLARAKTAESKRQRDFQEDMKTLKAKVDQAIRRAENEFVEARRKIGGTSVQIAAAVGRFRQAKEELRQTVQPAEVRVEELKAIRPGDVVLVRSLDKNGEVVAVHEAKGKVEVLVGGVKVWTGKKDLAQAKGRKKEKEERVWVNTGSFSQSPFELNLLGMTVDEALPVVEKSLDQATLGGVKSLAIIHGVGTGRLREAVCGFLKENPQVKGFYRPERRAGGEGVTMVELND